MTIQDDQSARNLDFAEDQDRDHEMDLANSEKADLLAEDMHSILKLISTQIDDADRRHTKVLGELQARLQSMGQEADATRKKVPPAYAPAFERIQDGIELLTGLVAKSSSEASSEAAAKAPATPDAETDIEASNASDADYALHDDANELVITDNAADRWEFDNEEQASDWSDVDASHAAQSDAEAQTTEEPAVLSDSFDQVEATAHRADVMSNEHAEIEDLPVRDEPPVFQSVPGSLEQPWTLQDAEALTQIYESGEAGFGSEPQPSSFAMSLAAPNMAAPEIKAEAQSPAQVQEEEQPVASEAPAQSVSQPLPLTNVANVAPAIEQAWLEQRFADIAQKVEEALFEIRDDGALNALSDRFGEFEQRVGSALEDVATRNDLDALKGAEAQIDSMVGYFERVETQLGRIDNLESQLEAIMDRFSDDRLMQLFAQTGPVDVDYSHIADAAAENVAQRFLGEWGNREEGTSGVDEMREALTAFMEERRHHDNESAGMLDTIQQALIRVLDRVDVLESSAPYPEMASEDDFAQPAAAAEAEADYDDDFDPIIEPTAQSEPAEEPLFGNDETQTALVDQPERATPMSREASASPAIERRERDYSQARLEYPAAVMGAVSASEPDEPKFEDEPVSFEEPIAETEFAQADDFGHQEDPLNTDDVPTRIISEAPVEDSAQVGQPFDAIEAEAHQNFASEDQGDWQQSEELPRANAIDRLRQEFIQDAKRARETAAQQALLEEQSAGSKPASSRKLGLSGLSKIGIKGIGKGKAAEEHRISPELPGATHAIDADLVTENETEPKSRFSVPRSKLLVGAVIVLFATAGALLMMRDKTETASVAPPAPIERQLQGTSSGPELAGPEDLGPELNGSQAKNAPGPQGHLDGGRVYDGDFNYDVAPTATKSSALSLDGVAVADLDKAPDPRKLASARRHRALAKMSSDLGAAAAYATPTSLLPDDLAAQVKGPDGTSVASTAKGNQLDLPPATVGPLSLRLAAAKGDPSAQFEVAARLAGGTGTQQNLKEAVRWYSRSAAQGFAQAHYRLGTLYERGLGVDKDLARSSLWYQRAAAKGNIKAMHNLAVVSASSDAGGPDYKTAAKWFEQAAQYGLADSQFNMAVLYENGLGVEKDLKQAFLYYSLAARQGDAQAVKRRDAVRAELSPTALSKAESKIRSFRPKMADKVVNDARAAGEDWKKRADHSYNQ